MTKEALTTEIPKMSSSIGLSFEKLQSCSNSDAIKTEVQNTAAVGSALNLEGTPTIYVNGRQLPGAQSLPVLQAAYNTLK